MKFCQTMVALCLFMIIGCSGGNDTPKATISSAKKEKTQKPVEGTIIVPDQPVSPEEVEKKLNERVAIWNEFYAPANQIAEHTNDPLAKEVVAFLQNNGSIAAPTPLGPQLLENGRSEKWFFIVALKEEDREIGKNWSGLLDQRVAGNFLPEVRMLVTKPHKITPAWKGLICLHEGLHAMRYMSEPYDSTDHRIFCHKELEAHEMQNKLTLAIGEVRYAHLIDTEVTKMKSQLDADGKQVGVHFLGRENNYPLLDGIFGVSQSPVEADFRATSVWIHCLFELVDRHFEGDKQECKAMILRTIYLEGGILKK